MPILEELLATIRTSAKASQVAVGPFLTAVAAKTCGGLATTQLPPRHQGREPQASDSGGYAGSKLRDLARLVLSPRPLEASLGLAALNAALPRETERLREQHGLDFLKARVKGRNLTLVGHFPFARELEPLARHCWILEQEPQAGDLPDTAAAQVIPDSQVVVITGSAFANRTIEPLLALARGKEVVVLGPSSPLSAVLFDYGVTAIGGTVVEDPGLVVRQVREGAVYRQLRGVKRVLMQK